MAMVMAGAVAATASPRVPSLLTHDALEARETPSAASGSGPAAATTGSSVSLTHVSEASVQHVTGSTAAAMVLPLAAPLMATGLGEGALVSRAPRFDIVFGIPISEDISKKMIKRVILLAALGATFYTVRFIRNLLNGRFEERESASDAANGRDSTSALWTAMSGLLIELSIPACGYYGAIHANRQLTCCFCSCNLFVTVLSVSSFIRLIRSVELNGQCESERNEQHRHDCQILSKYPSEKYVMISSMLVGAFLACVAFWFGGSLYKHLAQDNGGTGPIFPPMVGEVIRLEAMPVAPVSVVPITQSSAAAAAAEAGDGGAASSESLLPPSPREIPSEPSVQAGPEEEGLDHRRGG